MQAHVLPFTKQLCSEKTHLRVFSVGEWACDGTHWLVPHEPSVTNLINELQWTKDSEKKNWASSPLGWVVVSIAKLFNDCAVDLWRKRENGPFSERNGQPAVSFTVLDLSKKINLSLHFANKSNSHRFFSARQSCDMGSCICTKKCLLWNDC